MIRSIAVASTLLFAVSTFADERPTKPALSEKNRSVEGLVVEKTSRGARAHLHGRFQHALVLRIAPDGSVSMECVDTAERAAELIGVKPVVKTAPKHED